LAAAIAGVLRQTWGAGPRMIIVEPEAAPALIESIKAERVVTTSGPLSQMGRLDCKTPSMLALADLARDADDFATITEDEAQRAVDQLGAMNMATTPSGAAGLAAALAGIGDLSADAHVLCIISEGPESG
jgi:diaminopropionate ammonia-lyase